MPKAKRFTSRRNINRAKSDPYLSNSSDNASRVNTISSEVLDGADRTAEQRAAEKSGMSAVAMLGNAVRSAMRGGNSAVVGATKPKVNAHGEYSNFTRINWYEDVNWY